MCWWLSLKAVRCPGWFIDIQCSLSKCLSSAGVNPNMRDDVGLSLLHWAVLRGNMVRIFETVGSSCPRVKLAVSFMPSINNESNFSLPDVCYTH